MLTPHSRLRCSTRMLATGSAVAVSVLALTAVSPQSASATSTAAQLSTSKTNGVSYLKSLQATDGSYVSGGLSNEWAFSALAAAGTAAVDVTPGGDTSKDARTVYRNQLSASSWPNTSPVVTDYERGVLNAYAAGIDPARVAVNRNLIADVLSYWQPSTVGYFGPPANFNGTVFGLLALAGAKTQAGAQRVPASLLAAGVAVVRANEHNDGGWDFGQAAGNSTTLAAASDIDMTGAAMASLCVSGVANTDPAVVAGKNFLKAKLVSSTGAFNSAYGVNTDSNGWGVSGLNACGFANQGTDFTTAAGKTPIDFLLAQQFNPAGGFKYQPANTTPSAYSSIDALRAVAGAGFTAVPPTPVTSGASQWVSTSSFTSGTVSRLAVVVDSGVAAALKACSVSLTATAATSTLGAVLDAAVSGATPTGCVTGSAPSTSTGTVTTINGLANTGSSTWKLSIDGGTYAAATRQAVIHLGDTISLKYGS